MVTDYDELPGFPFAGTAVHQDATRIGPVLMSPDRRQECRDAHNKWRSANRDKAIAATRNWRERRKAQR